MLIDEVYMYRCIELAKLGKNFVAPNPMVGAVLVYEDKIIGEGYHQQYGKAHAEVNCINSVAAANEHLIAESVLYVSLEPCAHYGKTPPCVDLIIKHNIKKVVIGSRDPFEAVNGRGIEKLESAGVFVRAGILEDECKELNKRFFMFHTKRKPFVILKWAQTSDYKIANIGNERLLISNDISNRLVHQWRSEEQAVLVGTNTALLDNPFLNNRLWTGNHPVRLVLDCSLKLPSDLHIFNQQQKTIVFNFLRNEERNNLLFYKIEEKENCIQQILNACYTLNIQSILIEGGAKILQSFIDENCWDEARIITNSKLIAGNGLCAPVLKNCKLTAEQNLLNDTIQYFEHE
jgi:diaminohydroxyphosphoribosylaminopyrimidine deaminase/5-amino-6-(5-phosphoribosylamino)uracil reductase